MIESQQVVCKYLQKLLHIEGGLMRGKTGGKGIDNAVDRYVNTDSTDVNGQHN